MKKNTAGKVKFIKGERIFMFLLILSFVTLPLLTVFSKSVLSKANIEVEQITAKIEKRKLQIKFFI